MDPEYPFCESTRVVLLLCDEMVSVLFSREEASCSEFSSSSRQARLMRSDARKRAKNGVFCFFLQSVLVKRFFFAPRYGFVSSDVCKVCID